jgi:serine/threonine-protein kinase
VGASLAFGLAGLAFGLLQARKPEPSNPVPAAPVAQRAPEPPAAPPAAAPEAKPPAAEVTPAPPAPVAEAKPPPEPAKPVVEAPPVKPPEPPKPPPEPPSLELTVSPPVEVSIDGKAVGRAPVTLPLEAGKHAIVLSDPSQGIRLTRSVTVGKAGKTRHSIVIGKASVSLTAPNGVKVFMDGRVVGTAPVGDISVFEGSHVIKVKMGKANWSQKFSVKPGDHMTFTVQTTPP